MYFHLSKNSIISYYLRGNNYKNVFVTLRINHLIYYLIKSFKFTSLFPQFKDHLRKGYTSPILIIFKYVVEINMLNNFFLYI